jgi:hypothetical protein
MLNVTGRPFALSRRPSHTGEMSDSPFTLSPEAAAQIDRLLAIGEAHPDCAALIPTLGVALSQMSRTPDGVVTERFRGECFIVGYHTRDEVARGDFVRLELCGRMLAIHEETLRRLAGKRLVVESVAVGVPRPADKKTAMLRAV